MKEHELLWAMLPEGLEPYFEIEDFQKTDKSFRIFSQSKEGKEKSSSKEEPGNLRG